MLDILPKNVWNNPNFKWLDNSTGKGNFMIIIYYKLMIGLKNIITSDKKRSKHIVENMLYMIEYNKDNVSQTLQIFKDIDSNSKCNIKLGDFLKESNTKFLINSLFG